MAEHKDNVIYLEHDAEITEAIDKLKKTAGDSVRIVVPPRSPLLQSVVNLKLLKKAATSKKKELVLVTGDKTATVLAGKVGIPVAKNVKAEAKVPESDPEPKRGHTGAAVSAAIAATALAAKDDAPTTSPLAQEDDLPVARYDAPESERAAATKKQKTNARGKKSRGKKVPDYNKFQKGIWIGASVVIGLIFLWLASAFLQTATVNVQAEADRRDVNTQFTLVTNGTGSGSTVSATELTTTKDLSQSVEATGQKDMGAKATGSITITNCSESDDFTIPAGSAVTTSGKKFTTNSAVSVPGAKFAGGACTKPGTANASITAAENGDSYNFSNATFTVANAGASTAKGSTSGGVSKILKVVSQGDVDAAAKALIETGKAEALTEMKSKAQDSQKVFDDTIKGEAVTTAANPPVGTEASNTTVTVKAKYTVLAADESALTAVVEDALEAELKGGSKVLDAGLDQAKITLVKTTTNGAVYSLSTVAYIGQPIDEEALRKEVAGKPKKEVPDIARQYQNVSGATVDGWPLVPNMPIPTGNIKVEITVTK